MSIDNETVQVMEGDFLLTALMLHRGYARISSATAREQGFA
jgi:hypothetical protein